MAKKTEDAEDTKKLVTVKLPVGLVSDSGAVARLIGLSNPAFIEKCILEGIARHTAKAKARLDQIAKRHPEDADC